MGLAALVSIFETSGAFPAMVVSLYTGILAAGVIARGFQTDRPIQSWAGVFLLAGDGAIRVMDSALTLTERGIFFLAIGVVAALICYVMYLPLHRMKKKKIRKSEQPGEEEDR